MSQWLAPITGHPAARLFAKFIVSGVFNTIVTYVLYLGLLQLFPYRLSYSLSYAAGFALAYELNRGFVFGAKRSARSMFAAVLIYALQYAAGLAIVWAWVGRFRLDARLAPLASLAITVPITFALMRLAFRRKSRGVPSGNNRSDEVE